MAYLGIDLEAAHRLAANLRFAAGDLQEIEAVVTDAALLADLPTPAAVRIVEVADVYRRCADHIVAAARLLERFRLTLRPFAWSVPRVGPGDSSASPTLPAIGASVAGAPRWDAAPDVTWDRIHQTASHNSYLVPGGVATLHGVGIRSFELDIHRGAPTDVLGALVPWSAVQSFVGIAADAVLHGGGHADDWLVYHDSLNSSSAHVTLSDGLAAIAELDESDPLTVFIDNKDRLGGDHDGEALDAVLHEQLGTRLFGPADLLARAPGATTLRQAIAQAGWPTVDELRGRVIVVLTDEIASYGGADVRAFVATAPRFESSGGSVVHLAEPDVVFHNEQHALLSPAEHAALQATDSVVRTYFGPSCTDPGEPVPNYRAIDVDGAGPQCAPRVRRPG